MSWELLIAGTAAVLSAWLLTRRHGVRLQLAALATALGVCALMALLCSARASSADPFARHRPDDRTQRDGSRWSSSRPCVACHPSEHASWSQTFHRTMTQTATPQTVVARWDGVTLERNGRRYYLSRSGDRFLVDMPAFGTSGETERMVRPVVMTTGSHHQQLYWMPVPWAELPVDGEGARGFVDACASCHGTDGIGGEAGPLRFMRLTPSAIAAALASHLAGGKVAPLDDIARDKVLAHVARLQLEDRLTQFPFAWLIHDQRWVHEDDTFLQPEPAPEAVEPYDEGWSDSCDGCHAVGATFTYQNGSDFGRAAVAELGIACEACHGPGAAHVLRHQNPLTRYFSHLTDERAPDDIVLPTRLDAARNAAICGQCHAETWSYQDQRPAFMPGHRLEDSARVVQWQRAPYPAWLQAALEEDDELMDSGFWRDGTIRIAGRDYNGLSISACHVAGGLTCTSCHAMHASDPNDQLKEAARGDAVCGECHAAIAAAPSGHSHHPEGAAGCYDCHMPRTTLGLLSVMRAHRIDSPSVASSVASGRPNACALCHVDRTIASIAADMQRWYGHDVPEALDDEVSASVRQLLSGDAVQRAVAAWHLGSDVARRASGSGWQAPLIAQLLDDPYAAVRYIAGRALVAQPGYEDFAYDYVGDPASRQQAVARALARSGKGDLPNELRALKQARDDTPVTVNE